MQCCHLHLATENGTFAGDTCLARNEPKVPKRLATAATFLLVDMICRSSHLCLFLFSNKCMEASACRSYRQSSVGVCRWLRSPPGYTWMDRRRHRRHRRTSSGWWESGRYIPSSTIPLHVTRVAADRPFLPFSHVYRHFQQFEMSVAKRCYLKCRCCVTYPWSGINLAFKWVVYSYHVIQWDMRPAVHGPLGWLHISEQTRGAYRDRVWARACRPILISTWLRYIAPCEQSFKRKKEKARKK